MKKLNPISFTLPTATYRCNRTAFVSGMGNFMETKKCSKCDETKLFSEFDKSKDSSDGLRSACKECTKKKTIEYKHSVIGLINITYNNQVANSIDRKHELPNYSEEELYYWIINNKNFDNIYNNWILSGYDRWSKPSCDRLDDNKPYSLDNIRLVTWKDNSDKQHYERKYGISNKCLTPVLQYDLQGNFVKEYYSVAHANRSMGKSGGDICAVCKNKRLTAHGYIWKYKQ